MSNGNDEQPLIEVPVVDKNLVLKLSGEARQVLGLAVDLTKTNPY